MSLTLGRNVGESILIVREGRAVIRIRFRGNGNGNIKLSFDGGQDPEPGLAVIGVSSLADAPADAAAEPAAKNRPPRLADEGLTVEREEAFQGNNPFKTDER